MFPLLLSKVGFQLISVLSQGFWGTFFYCLQTSGFDWIVYFFLHISWFFALLLEFSFWGIILLHVCSSWVVVYLTFFKFFVFSLIPFGFHCSVSCQLVKVPNSVAFNLILLINVFFGCCCLLLFVWDFWCFTHLFRFYGCSHIVAGWCYWGWLPLQLLPAELLCLLVWSMAQLFCSQISWVEESSLAFCHVFLHVFSPCPLNFSN